MAVVRTTTAMQHKGTLVRRNSLPLDQREVEIGMRELIFEDWVAKDLGIPTITLLDGDRGDRGRGSITNFAKSALASSRFELAVDLKGAVGGGCGLLNWLE